jgi:hypothetical protein
MLKDKAPIDYLNKRCYVKSATGFWWLPRRIWRIRSMRDEYGSQYWQVLVRNWFWFEWYSTRSISLEEWISDLPTVKP